MVPFSQPTEVTHHRFADFDGVFEDGPGHYFVAARGGEGAQVAVVLGTIHSIQKVIQGYFGSDVDIVT